ncbi:MAG: TetR family transcriptional regulator [Anaerolineae bacterium]|nr:TetR family transcriptional regulator [Anaerolineae bacterium]
MPRPPSDAKIRIVHAALRLFATRGYYHTSIADILRESGCTRGTLYYYFSSKEELGYAVIDEELRLVVEQGAVSHLRGNEPFVDRLLRAFDDLPSTLKLESGHSVISGLVPRVAAVHEGFRQHLLAREQAIAEEFQEMVRTAIADGELAESVDPDELTHFTAIVTYGIQMARLLGQEQVMPEGAGRWLKEYLNSLRR